MNSSFAWRYPEARLDWLARRSHDAIALLARIAMAATFWLSGQSKIEGLVLDPIGLQVQWGVPHLSAGALDLFRTEYRLPFLAPEFAASMAAVSEHLFPLLLLLGVATRFSALALLGMTAVIQVFVYPGAWPTHALWATCLLYLMARGPGAVSMDHMVTRHWRGKPGSPWNRRTIAASWVPSRHSRGPRHPWPTRLRQRRKHAPPAKTVHHGVRGWNARNKAIAMPTMRCLSRSRPTCVRSPVACSASSRMPKTLSRKS